MQEGGRERKWGTRGFCSAPGCVTDAAGEHGFCRRHYARISDELLHSAQRRVREATERANEAEARWRYIGGPVLVNLPQPFVRPAPRKPPKRRKYPSRAERARQAARAVLSEHGRCGPDCDCQVQRRKRRERASAAEYMYRRPWFPRSDLSPAEFAQMFNWLYAHAEVLTDARYVRKTWFPEEELPRRALGQMRDWLQNFSDVLTETDTQKGRRE